MTYTYRIIVSDNGSNEKVTYDCDSFDGADYLKELFEDSHDVTVTIEEVEISG